MDRDQQGCIPKERTSITPSLNHENCFRFIASGSVNLARYQVSSGGIMDFMISAAEYSIDK
jgi:hypothetical protein